MPKIIFLRHGQSEWNLENLFTGWTDVELSDKGREEARNAGRLIKNSGLKPEYYFTSYLRRAIHTLQLAASEMDREWVPVIKDWHLNERHYGALQGLNKADTATKYGEEQVHIWRRSYDVEPPALDKSDPRWPGNDEMYAQLTYDELPLTESLKDAIERTPLLGRNHSTETASIRHCVGGSSRKFNPRHGHDVTSPDPRRSNET